MSDDGVAKSAILLLSLGEEEAAEVLKLLSPKEVQKLGAAMAKLKNVPRQKIHSVLEEFHKRAAGQSPLGLDSTDYIKSVLTKALGNEKANFILERILQSGDTSGIEGLKWMEASNVAELISNEHPQIIASILVHLERDHAAEILTHLPDRLKGDVILRVATLDGIQPNALRELNDVLSKMLTGSEHLKKAALGGVRAAAEILNHIGNKHEAIVMEAIKEHDVDLAQNIVDEMFTFDSLIDVDDRGLQLLLREVQSDSLVVALKGASEDLRERIFKNMSQRAADMLREDLDAKGPVRLSEVEAEQKDILKVVRRLVEEGQMSAGSKGEEAYV